MIAMPAEFNELLKLVVDSVRSITPIAGGLGPKDLTVGDLAEVGLTTS
jgi:hypothetical protein